MFGVLIDRIDFRRKGNSLSFLARSIAFSACLAAFCSLAAAQTTGTQSSGSAQQQQQQPPPKKNNRAAAQTAPAAEPFDGATVERMAAQCVRLETEAGLIEMEMLPETAPETVRNFLNLAATGAFDGTTFHRTVKGFVIQGGSVMTKPQPSPEVAKRMLRAVPDEPNPVKHVRGIVSMARSEKPNSATSSFFILVGEASHLDGTFAAFGRITQGMDVVDAINKAPAIGDKPDKPVQLKRATVQPCPPPTSPAPQP
jgi:peptidyl-prolyl cis-trans isomerase B (cyclophilin B)